MKTDNKPLSHYGIHSSDEGIQYLFQDTCPYGWEFVGLKNKRSNMSVKHLKNQCPHITNVHLATRQLSNKLWKRFLEIFNDPLVQAMLPIPNGKSYFLDQRYLDSSSQWLTCLERLSSPLYTGVRPVWTISLANGVKELGVTNAQPLVLTDFDDTDVSFMSKLVASSATSPRTMIMTSAKDLITPKGLTRIETDLPELIALEELISLPLEHIGAYLIAQYCRGELGNLNLKAS